MNIGVPERTVIVEPKELPIPRREAIEEPSQPLPVEEPAEVQE